VLNKLSGPQIDRTAAERSQPPQPPGAPLGGLVLGSALLASFLIHGALLGTVLVASPRPNPTEHVESVTVDLVPETEPETPPPPETPQPAVKKPEPRLEIPDMSQMLAAQQAIQSPPQPVPAPAPKQPAAQAAAAPSDSSPASAAAPEPQPDTAPPPVTETSPQDAIAAAARISDLMHLPELAALGAFDGAPSDTKAKLSATEIAAFREELRKCWNAPGEVPANQKPRAVIRVALKQDGSFSAQPQLLSVSVPRYGAPVVKSAMDALAKCQPYRSLPAGKYNEWKLLDLAFTAQDVAGVNPIADAKAPPKQ
jgi:outer membrane biosynthesis protein TonB